MTIQEHLEIVYPQGAPADIATALSDEGMTDAFARARVLGEIERLAKDFDKRHKDAVDRVINLETRLREDRRELDAVETKLSNRHHRFGEMEWMRHNEKMKSSAESAIAATERQIADLKASPYFDAATAASWSELGKHAVALSADPDGAKAIENLPVVDLVSLAFDDDRSDKIRRLAAEIEQGDVVDDVRKEIFERKERYGDADPRRKLACRRILQIIEARLPRPFIAAKNL